MLIAGPRHLQAVLDKYVEHYNQHRPHRARSLRPPDCDDTTMAPVTDMATTPRKGLGLMGLVVFLPGLFVAGAKAFGALSGVTGPPAAARESTRFVVCLLLGMSVSAFLAVHVVLRFQSVGVLRLMLPCVVSGAPLAAVPGQRRRAVRGDDVGIERLCGGDAR